MRKWLMVLLVFCLTSVVVDADQYWPQWRGPAGTGVAPEGDPPVAWSEDKNIRWKVELPGGGHATPIVWSDQVFVSVAVRTDNQGASGESRRGVQPTQELKYEVMALDRKTGKVVWQKTARQEMPHEGRKAEGSWASPSAVTDGKYLYVSFGSRGLYCYDLDGNLKWEKDLGDLQIYRGFGEGTSPVLYGNTLVVNWDHEAGSFIVALDKTTGKEVWRKDRDEGTTWTTPLAVDHNGKPQVIIPGTYKTRSYDLATGNLVWECAGLTRNVVPSPVYADGVVYIMSGFRGNLAQAIRLDKAKGDITDSDAIVWSYEQDTPYVPSPLLYEDHLYFFKSNNGILSCLNAKTGEVIYGPTRLEGVQGFYASPVGAKGRVYLASQNGTTLVIKHGPEFEVLATNVLDESFNASPVIVDNEIYLRGARSLYCIAKD